MAALAGTMLVWPGTVLDKLWTLNQPAHKALAPAGSFMGPLFFLLSITLVTAAVGWFKQRVWGWRLTVLIISTQVIGDFVNLMRGDLLRGGTGLLIAGALLFYLLRSNIRTTFQ
jgi:mannose/fructose/N-acetylgalactosamine-specific phosphotransferase system component IID